MKGSVILPENRKTQTQRVLQYMRDFGSITAVQGMAGLGVLRRAARIADLRKAGYAIESKTIQVRNRYGKTCNVAQYSERSGDG